MRILLDKVVLLAVWAGAVVAEAGQRYEEVQVEEASI